MSLAESFPSDSALTGFVLREGYVLRSGVRRNRTVRIYLPISLRGHYFQRIGSTTLELKGAMRENGSIIHVGPAKGGHWQVSD